MILIMETVNRQQSKLSLSATAYGNISINSLKRAPCCVSYDTFQVAHSIRVTFKVFYCFNKKINEYYVIQSQKTAK